MASPNAMAVTATEPTYMAVARRPMVLPRIITEAKLAVGPAIRRTKATPGVSPLSISDIAMGIDPVAQTYMGIATRIMASIASMG